MEASPPERPIRLVVRDPALERTRLTVFFRLLLAIPVFVWLALWGIAAFFVSIVLWFAILFRGTAPQGMHGFIAGYLRYWTHVTAYLFLAADPYPWFRSAVEYPVDLEIDEPRPQNRWKVGFRFLLALPAVLLATTLGGAPADGGGQFRSFDHGGGGDPDWRFWGGIGGVAAACAFLTWFFVLVRARAPRGLRDLTAFSLGYAAQATGYLLLLTDRYPSAQPRLAAEYATLSEHPVRLTVDDPLERSRLTVFLRLLLAIPHFVWLALWTFANFFVVLVAWFAALITGKVPDPLHRFMSAYLRYVVHLGSYLALVGGRFPGFTGQEGSYGIDLHIDGPERQSRWVTLFRVFLAIPAFIVSGALDGVLFVLAVLGWWYALVTGRACEGLRDLGAVCLRYSAQTHAYFLLLTPRYPSGSPLLTAPPTVDTQHPEPDIAPPYEPGGSY